MKTNPLTDIFLISTKNLDTASIIFSCEVLIVIQRNEPLILWIFHTNFWSLAACTSCNVSGAVHANHRLLAYGQGTYFFPDPSIKICFLFDISCWFLFSCPWNMFYFYVYTSRLYLSIYYCACWKYLWNYVLANLCYCVLICLKSLEIFDRLERIELKLLKRKATHTHCGYCLVRRKQLERDTILLFNCQRVQALLSLPRIIYIVDCSEEE